MVRQNKEAEIAAVKRAYPGKFTLEEVIFGHIHWGDHIFIGSGCSEPQYLARSFIEYMRANPKAILDAEILQLWPLGSVPYADENLKDNFRHNSFFIGKTTREAVNKGLADYIPVSLSNVPGMFYKGLVPVDVALIQTSLPDTHGYVSLGVNVDIVKSAVENAELVIAQMNSSMPRVAGDGFIHMNDIDFAIHYDEPLLEYPQPKDDKAAKKIGEYASRLVRDGDTIQVGYGNLLNSVLSNLKNKKDLGVHTDLLSEGLVELMRKGVVNNSKKTMNRGKSIASFCMGVKKTYDYIDDNLAVELRTVDYTNNPLVIAQHDNMTAINSAFSIDLTGQATGESVGKMFYGGIGGQADFMRGAVMAKNGKTILVVQSTSEDGSLSRIVPFIEAGSGVTLNRADIHYVVTEYGIAYLPGKNIRERAMDLIAIAHPKFRPYLIDVAKKLNLIYADQAFIPGKKGEYPVELETYRTTKKGLRMLLRPVRISDEPLLKDFFYSLTEDTFYQRFVSTRRDMPHERLQDFTVIDYTRQMVILAIKADDTDGGKEVVMGLGQYEVNEKTHTAEVAFVVEEDFQNQGVGRELLNYLVYLAKRQGLLGFTAEVLPENDSMMHLFQTLGFHVEKKNIEGMYEFKIMFTDKQ